MGEKISIAAGRGKCGRGIPADVIKLTAIVLMLVDHVAAVFSDRMGGELYMWMRAVGRISFPLFAFLIVEGFFHTRNVKKYLIRLSAFALISEFPFDYAFFWYLTGGGYWKHQNVFITLAMGLGTIWILDIIRKKITSMEFAPHLAQLLLQVLVISMACVLADLTFADYGSFGILLIVLFYFCHSGKGAQCLALAAWALLYDAAIGKRVEIYAVAGLILLLFYNGEKGKLPVPKWVFYGFYPLHLLILGLIRNVLMGG